MRDPLIPEMPQDTWAALERLLEIAHGDSGQCRDLHVAGREVFRKQYGSDGFERT